MPAKNLYLDDELAAVATAVAKDNPRHKNLSRLVTHLLTSHLRANPKVRTVCQKNGIKFPVELLAK